MSYRVVVAVSGNGSNFVALANALHEDPVAEIAMVVADRPARAFQAAEERGIATHLLRDFRDATEWLTLLRKNRCDLLVLAGYLRLVPAEVVAAMRGRIINVHPALLPKFGGRGMHGARVHEAVIVAGDAVSGATVHLVDEVYDSGSILAQGVIDVPAGATASELAAAVLAVEHRLLPAAVRTAARAGVPVPFDFT